MDNSFKEMDPTRNIVLPPPLFLSPLVLAHFVSKSEFNKQFQKFFDFKSCNSISFLSISYLRMKQP